MFLEICIVTKAFPDDVVSTGCICTYVYFGGSTQIMEVTLVTITSGLVNEAFLACLALPSFQVIVDESPSIISGVKMRRSARKYHTGIYVSPILGINVCCISMGSGKIHQLLGLSDRMHASAQASY
jgi:hypothetical protein